MRTNANKAFKPPKHAPHPLDQLRPLHAKLCRSRGPSSCVVQGGGRFLEEKQKQSGSDGGKGGHQPKYSFHQKTPTTMFLSPYTIQPTLERPRHPTPSHPNPSSPILTRTSHKQYRQGRWKRKKAKGPSFFFAFRSLFRVTTIGRTIFVSFFFFLTLPTANQIKCRFRLSMHFTLFLYEAAFT